jgi:hypothetical protein
MVLLSGRRVSHASSWENSRNKAISCNAYSIAGSERPNHSCIKCMRSNVAMVNRLTARFACRRKWLNQASQLRLRGNKIHLVKKLKLNCSLGDQFKNDGGKGGLFHEDIRFKSGVTKDFAELL